MYVDYHLQVSIDHRNIPLLKIQLFSSFMTILMDFVIFLEQLMTLKQTLFSQPFYTIHECYLFWYICGKR